MNTPFWNAQYPFRDFVTISSKHGDINNDLLEILKLKSRQIKLNIKKISKFDNISNYIVSDNLDEDTSYLNKNNIWFSGICEFDGKFYYGQDSIDREICINNELFDTTGIFTCINSYESEITIKHDYFGCELLYYFENESYVLVSNRYHLLLIMISTLGYKLELDMTKVASNFYADVNLFATNIFKNMDMKGVYQLPIENYISISEKGFIIKERKDYIEILSGKISESYDELLLKAKEEIIENIKTIMNANLFDKYVIDLSGGADSRVVFAGISSLDNCKDKIQIRTSSVESSDDLDVALKINSLYNYNFYKREDIKTIPISLTESLDMWNSYFMGCYHRMGLSPWGIDKSSKNEIRLSGGMGELYRATGYKQYKSYICKSEDSQSLVNQLMDSLGVYIKTARNYKEEISNLLQKEIDLAYGKTIEDKFSNFYFIKYRYHFGMRALEYYSSQPIYYPLMSKSAFKASMLLSVEDKIKDKFMIDITKILNEVLIYIDYNNDRKYANDLLKEGRDNNHYNLDSLSTEEMKIKWKESKDYNEQIMKKSALRYPYIDHKEFYTSWRDMDQYIYSEIIKLYYELKKYSKELNDFLDDDFLETIYGFKNNRNKIYKIYSILRSIDEQIKI